MMRKKHLLQNNNLIKPKIDSPNAKVTVQYIQNPPLFPNTSNINNHDNMVHAIAEDLEVENVEYLEENTNVEEYIEDDCEKDEIDDNFYPNAIYCLLDLYKTKYESLNGKNVDCNADQLWHDIAKDMQESLFEFNESQIQHKYAKLKEQYFGIQTKEDIENFDYFDQLHDIYKDLSKDNIAKDPGGDNDRCEYYKDEIILQPAHLEDERNLHDFKSKEIANKEHEFIDMVEKELQAMEDGLQVVDKESIETEMQLRKTGHATLNNLGVVESAIGQQTHVNKRFRLDSELCEEPLIEKPKPSKLFKPNNIIEDTCKSCNTTSKEFSLQLYNQEQERRHREKMSLIEKSLQIQERSLEQQHQLLQELIKRLS